MKRAVFTPWGQVLCVPCHNSQHDKQLVEGSDSDHRFLTRCNKCGCEIISCRNDVQVCNNLADASDGLLSVTQTGGMCVNTQKQWETTAGYILMSFGMNEDTTVEGDVSGGIYLEDLDGGYLGEYHGESAFVGSIRDAVIWAHKMAAVIESEFQTKGAQS